MGRINCQHFTRFLCCCSCGIPVLCHTGSPHWHCCLWWCGTAETTNLRVKPIPGGIRHHTRANSLQSLGKDSAPLSFYCIPDIHFLKKPHLQLLAIPGSKDEIQTKTRTREVWAGFLRSHCSQQRWSQGRLESGVNVPQSR